MGDEREELLGAVAEQLVAQRIGLGLEIEDAAKVAGIEPERLAAAEEAQLALSEEELLRLADAYGVGITAFFGGKVTPYSYLFGA